MRAVSVLDTFGTSCDLDKVAFMNPRRLCSSTLAFATLLLNACGAVRADTDGSLSHPEFDAGDDVVTDAGDASSLEDAGAAFEDGGSANDGDTAHEDANTDAADTSRDASDVEEGGEEKRPDELDCTEAEAPPEPPKIECDLFAEPSTPGGCGSTQVCSPYAIKAGGCTPPTYGTRCIGTEGREAGQPCSAADHCAAGHACAITTTGYKCAKLCRLDDPTGCPDGLVCWPVEEFPNLGACW